MSSSVEPFAAHVWTEPSAANSSPPGVQRNQAPIHHEPEEGPSRGSNGNVAAADAVESQRVNETTRGEIVRADEGDQTEAIIALLEDWATWERTLEAGVNIVESPPAAQEVAVVTVADKSVASLNGNKAIPARRGNDSSDNNASEVVVTEVADDETRVIDPAVSLRKNEALSASCSKRDSDQLIYMTRRERRRAERRDPGARARRQALKLWASDQRRRRSSADESTASRTLRRQCWSRDATEQAINVSKSSLRSSRRSSADATVDRNRGRNSTNERFRTNASPPRRFVSREVSKQLHARKRAGQQRSSRPATAQISKQQAAIGKGALSLYPGREITKTPDKWGVRGENALTAPPTPTSPASVSSPSSNVAGRGSPWARSPSRETAGGILVKHCFFYGSSGKKASRGAAAATTSPSFESPWMRQFREEVQSNPNWWAGSDRYVLDGATSSFSGKNLGVSKWARGRPSRQTMSAGVTPRGSGRKATSGTELWEEVRSLLAGGHQSHAAKRTHEGVLGRQHGNDGKAAPGRVDLSSFGDRLRYTPLSQRAWVVDRATAAVDSAAVSISSAEQSPNTTTLLREDNGIGIPGTEAFSTTVTGADVEGQQLGNKEANAHGSDLSSSANRSSTLRKEGEGLSNDNDTSQTGGRGSCQDLQSIQAVTLAKLRGEIDPITREQLVLRAAEEARGALARDRARSSSPRRASVGVFRSSAEMGKRGSIPDSIDYDKVEATLSLIELATRAAGPDAGKQMFQALEGLDRIYQRALHDKDTAKEGRQGPRKRANCTGFEEADNYHGLDGARVRGSAESTKMIPKGLLATTIEECLFDAVVVDQEEASGKISRKLSLALSSSSEESMHSDSSIGKTKNTGNAGPEGKEYEHGSNEFPLILKESGENKINKTGDEAKEPSSNLKQEGIEAARALNRLSVSSTDGSAAAKSESAEQKHHSKSTEAQASRSISGLEARQAGDLSSLQNGMTGATDGPPIFCEQSLCYKSVNKSLGAKARRKSEADKPTSLPKFAAEIAMVEGMVLKNGNIDCETAVPDSAEEGKIGNERDVAKGTVAADHKALCENLPTREGFQDVSRGDFGAESVFPITKPEKDGAPNFPTKTTEARGEEEERELLQQSVTKDGGMSNTDSHVSALKRRDSWVSVGTRPGRGACNFQVDERTDAGVKDVQSPSTVSTRPEECSTLSRKETHAGREPMNDKEEATDPKNPTGGRWAPPKVSAKFVWPRPGRACNPKRLRPPEKNKDHTSSTSPRRGPGIVRRSTLIDALHPEVTRQRQFYQQLRQTRQREEPPSPPKSKDIAKAARLASGAVVANCVKAEELASPTPTNVEAHAGRRSKPIMAHAVDRTAGRGRSSLQAAASNPAAVVIDSPASPNGRMGIRHRCRSGWTAAVQLLAPQFSATSPPVPSGPARGPLSLSPNRTSSRTSTLDKTPTLAKSDASGSAAAASAGRLTAQQWEGVEAWMAEAKCSLGPKCWVCVGSSDAFRRARNYIWRSIASRGGAFPETNAGEDISSPTDESVPRKGPPESGTYRGSRGGHVRRNVQAKKDRKPGFGKKPKQEQEQKKGERDLDGWDQRLSEKAALTIDAVMWTIATERERSITCAASIPGRGGDDATVSTTAPEQEAQGYVRGALRKSTQDPNPAETASRALLTVEELRVSMQAARRFIKSSQLVDGVSVLDADVDLAFKRWEEVGRLARRDGRLARRDGHSLIDPATPEGVSERKSGHVVNGKAKAAFDSTETKLNPKRQCEAVGCSDPAQYADIHPLAKARLCRKHKSNGMVDVGSRRCERPGCGRLAVGARAKNATTSGALCTLHTREGRVDVEGLAFVLLSLSRARYTRIRRPAAGTMATISVEEETPSACDGRLGTQELTEALPVLAVRNVLLALTNQPLVLAQVTPGEEASPTASERAQMLNPSKISSAKSLQNHYVEHIARSIESVRVPSTAAGPAAVTSTPNGGSAPRKLRQHVGRRHDDCFIPDDVGGSREWTPSGTQGAGITRNCSRSLITIAGFGSPDHFARRSGETVGMGSGSRGHTRAENNGECCWEEEAYLATSGPGSSTMAMPEPQEVNGETLDDCQASHLQLCQDRSGSIFDDGYVGGVSQHHVKRWKLSASHPRSDREVVGGGSVQSWEIPASLDWRRDQARRSGINEVLGKNARPLQAMFHKYSRQSEGPTRKANMFLPDILRLCDAFELRPGLVLTREIIDAYKKVAYPGVEGLTDEEVGYFSSFESPDLSNTMESGLRMSEIPDQARPSSAATLSHGVPATALADGERNSAREGHNPEALPDTPLKDDEVGNDAMDYMALEDLAKATVESSAEERGTSQDDNGRVINDRGSNAKEEGRGIDQARGESDGEKNVSVEGRRRGSGGGGGKGADQRQKSERSAGIRRGTSQQEDDECSLYFRSDSACDGNRKFSPSRRTSTASSTCVGRKGKRTVYLGRAQAFPLRRVESSLAVDARGFGLSGVSPDMATGGVSRRRGNRPRVSTSEVKPSSRISSVADDRGEGEFLIPVMTVGMTEPHFFEWLAEIALECKALSTKKALGHSPMQTRGKTGKVGEGCRGNVESDGRVNIADIRRQSAARAVVLLQWMEVSRGMRAGKQWGLPPFQLSSCL